MTVMFLPALHFPEDRPSQIPAQIDTGSQA